MKVQHKQIRRQEHGDREDDSDGFGPNMDANYQQDYASTLPQSGPDTSNEDLWLDREVVHEAGHAGTVMVGDAVVGVSSYGPSMTGEGESEVVVEKVSPLTNFDQALQNALPDIAREDPSTATATNASD